MKVLVIGLCAAAIIVCGFMFNKPWLAGLGLVIGFAAMWVDHGHVRLDGDERYREPSMETRKARSKRKA